MREAVRRLKELGPLPDESAPADVIQRHEDVLRTIAEPVTDDEARLLAGLFGPDDCHGLAWTLLHRALLQMAQWCRTNRHRSVVEQQRSLNLKLQGHYGYYGITGNFRALARFQWGVQSVWCKWLNRRSQKARMTWARFCALLKRYPLAPPRVVHSVYRAANP